MRMADFEKFEQFGLARDLLMKGLRPVPTASLTGLSPDVVRSMCRLLDKPINVYGATGTCIHLCRNRKAQMRWSLFALIYRDIGGQKVMQGVDPHALMTSYELFRNCSGIDETHSITGAWIVAHEMRSAIVKLSDCRVCGLRYLLIFGSARLPLSCPFCDVRDRRPKSQSLVQAVNRELMN